MVRARRLLLAATLAALLIGAVAGSAVALDAIPERLPDAVVGQPYEAELEAEEGCIPYTFAYDSGNYPPGLVVDPTQTYSTGKIHGTPTTPGWYYFYIEVTDICGSVPSQGDWSIFIHPPLVITTSALPIATPGSPYTAKLTANSGDTSTLEWSLVGGSLPAGLALNKDGTISGTTSAAGQYTLVVEVYDRNIRRTQKTLGLTVGAQLTASAPSAQRGEVGVAFRTTLGSTGGVAPKTWSVATGSLPPGLTLNATTGAITGRPTTAGSYALTFAVTDASGARASTAAAIGIVARLRIATAALPAAVQGSPYRARVAVGGGARPVSWTKASGALPPGIRLNARTGGLAGTPTGAGRYRFTLAARDPLGGVARKPFTLVVR
jgi:putative Ig domain-containing protein